MVSRTSLERGSPGVRPQRGTLPYESGFCIEHQALSNHPQAYLKQLQDNPLRTKMLTSGSLAAAQELLASWIAHDRSKHGHYVSSRVPKMAIYGAFISAPLGHVLISILQKLFKNRTSLKAKILQILISNLIVRLPSGTKVECFTWRYLILLPRSPQFRTAFTSFPWP